jgi:hypothetical protein
MAHVRFVRQSFYQLMRAIPAHMMILVAPNAIGLGKYALAVGANHALSVVVKFNLPMKNIKSILSIIKDNTP